MALKPMEYPLLLQNPGVQHYFFMPGRFFLPLSPAASPMSHLDSSVPNPTTAPWKAEPQLKCEHEKEDFWQAASPHEGIWDGCGGGESQQGQELCQAQHSPSTCPV